MEPRAADAVPVLITVLSNGSLGVCGGLGDIVGGR